MHSSVNQLLHWFVLVKRNPKVFKNQPLNVRIQCQMLALISLELLLSLYPIHLSHSVLEEWSADLHRSPSECALQSCELDDKRELFLTHVLVILSTMKPTLSKTALFCSWTLGVKALKTNILDNSSCFPVISPGLFRYYNKIQDDSAGVSNRCRRISHRLAVCCWVRLPFR